jgi:Tn3 transposase DDE domain
MGLIKAVKAIFLCRLLHDEALRQEIHDGLQVIENWNSAKDYNSPFPLVTASLSLGQDGFTMQLEMADVTSSVMVRDKNDQLEYAD